MQLHASGPARRAALTLFSCLLFGGCAGGSDGDNGGGSDSARAEAELPAPTAVNNDAPAAPARDVDCEQAAGRALFLANCAECHQSDGRGIANVYPALDGNELVLGSGIDVALVLRIGRGEMPSFLGVFDAQETAALINYVRNAWSNQGDRLSAEDIAALDRED